MSIRNLLVIIAINVTSPLGAQITSTVKVDLLEYAEKRLLLSDKRVYTAIGDEGYIRVEPDFGAGVLWLSGVSFSKGIVEFDIRGRGLFQRSSLGIAFNRVNDSTYEAVSFSPFNFLASDSAFNRAVQYISTPAFNTESTLRETSQKYPIGILPFPDPNGWFHVQVAIDENFVTVYINERIAAALTVKRLTGHKGKGLGLWIGDQSDGDFRNFTYKSIEQP